MNKKHGHFKGKNALQHIFDAQLKGLIASSEVHGAEVPGHLSSAADAAKETAITYLILWFLFPSHLLLLFLLGYLIWKTGRSAILGYSRLERLHRLAEEEKWEIEHHRDQEKEELTALYAAKGFSGKLLEEVIDVLMADDNRLLQVMIEEEMGINLESYEHPLKQAAGAFAGVLGSGALLTLGAFFGFWGVFIAFTLIVAISAGITAKIERNRPLHWIVWNLGVGILGALVVHFALRMV